MLKKIVIISLLFSSTAYCAQENIVKTFVRNSASFIGNQLLTSARDHLVSTRDNVIRHEPTMTVAGASVTWSLSRMVGLSYISSGILAFAGGLKGLSIARSFGASHKQVETSQALNNVASAIAAQTADFRAVAIGLNQLIIQEGQVVKGSIIHARDTLKQSITDACVHVNTKFDALQNEVITLNDKVNVLQTDLGTLRTEVNTNLTSIRTEMNIGFANVLGAIATLNRSQQQSPVAPRRSLSPALTTISVPSSRPSTPSAVAAPISPDESRTSSGIATAETIKHGLKGLLNTNPLNHGSVFHNIQRHQSMTEQQSVSTVSPRPFVTVRHNSPDGVIPAGLRH